ncbi:hypothetical protein N665_0583s0011 [Sinapis alba]|nr:hypothetical protein N665_0583s0011 [Sinapis alba]
MLTASQFGKVLQMGDHTFSVMFLHYLLSRQLVIEKDFELWWLFVGKPIRYAIQDFAHVTGLNCILCPTCGTTNIRSDVVSMPANLDEFIAYPWGQESFLLTVRSTKAHSPSHYVLHDTTAIQGFTHTIVLVTVVACPMLLLKPGVVAQASDENETSEEIVRSLIDRKLTIKFVSTKVVDRKGQAFVRSLLSSDESDELLYHGFEHNTWTGGVKADEVKVKKGPQIPAESINGNVSYEGEEVPPVNKVV